MTDVKDDPNDISTILKPLATIFSFSQIESILYAYLPTYLDKTAYLKKTNIYAVDTFVVTASVTLVLVLARLVMKLIQSLGLLFSTARPRQPRMHEISVIVEPTHHDDYHSSPNIYHQALSHLISKHAQRNSSGSYRLKPNMEADHEEHEPPTFDIIPLPNQTHTIIYDNNEYQIMFEPAAKSSIPAEILPGSEYSKPGIKGTASNEPNIHVKLQSKQLVTVSTMSTYLTHITKEYIQYMASLKRKSRTRHDYSVSGKWVRICSLYEIQGLDTVALCPNNESLIKQDLTSFQNNKPFYKRIGFPYRRGYLLVGPPGTGKTSLVFAIASELKRDLYFMNLAYIDTDSELFQAFSNVPKNAVIVFEDVDTMSSSLYNRKVDTNDSEEKKFNLSTFLSILDGHTLEEGIIFIMTTNHPEKLDPAVIRPGRMDVHLNLTLATHHQIRRMFQMVSFDNTTLDEIYREIEEEIEEFVIPPSEIMQIMVLCRKDVDLIPSKLKQLNNKYSI